MTKRDLDAAILEQRVFPSEENRRNSWDTMIDALADLIQEAEES